MSPDRAVSPPTSPTSDSPASNPPRCSRRRALGHLRSYTHSLASGSQPPTKASVPQRQSLIRSISHPPTVVLPNDDSVPQRQGLVRSVSHQPVVVLPNHDSSPPPRDLDSSESSSLRATSEEDRRTGSIDSPGPREASHTTRAIISSVMARYRSGSEPQGQRTTVAASETDNATPNLMGYPQDQMPTIRLIPHQDPRSNRPSLAFPPTSRTLPHEDCVIRVGRYSERDTNPNPPPNVPSSAPVGFKSKVVSRRHCEFWCSNGQWYIKDVKSSSGTFLNHIRLSQPSMESKPFPVNDGDVVQLGIDFRGGEEMIFRCVKIRVECNRAWQKSLNNFNMTTHKRLRDLGKLAFNKDSDASSAHSSECSICLMSIAPCQSLFVAPCSHVWHYRCVRPILNDHKTWPQFLCPNCRAVADLEADVDDPNDVRWEDEDAEESEAGKLGTDGAKVAAALPESSEDDESLAASTSRMLSIRNEAFESRPEAKPGPQTSASSSAPQPSLLSRRNFANSTPFSLGPNFQEAMAPENYLRPITPTRPLMHDDDLTPSNESVMYPAMTPNAFAMLGDGPMTPTNDAGPFVFDGSAGRAVGNSAPTAVPQGSERSA